MVRREYINISHVKDHVTYQPIIHRCITSGVNRIFSTYSIGIAPSNNLLQSLSRIQITENSKNRDTVATVSVGKKMEVSRIDLENRATKFVVTKYSSVVS